MAIKKSELYSTLWSSCDELRGGMDPSQYKDYVLSILFIKYISDKYAGQAYAPIKIPAGADFGSMVELKGKTDIGEKINENIIKPLAERNAQLSQSDFPDFNDNTRLGDGKELVERLTKLIGNFEEKLDFSNNRAEDDDVLGDAYEYLMRHFATESGKSKGQFYTPSEVSRVMAQILGIKKAVTSSSTTVYDPTCGSGSLLLKISDEAGTPVSLYGQEKDVTTSGLSRMNMILHDNPTAVVKQGNTLSSPKFLESDGKLKSFDYVVANPPFSDKRWSTGLDPEKDPHERFKAFGVPPAKQGDYAYLLHIIRSLKSTATGVCVLPHGVLYRGNAEEAIRKNLIKKGYIKGIIGMPANLFYGTNIPACLVVVDKAKARSRDGIFMIDASKGFIKDGNKNRLREQDIQRIVDVFNSEDESNPKFARMVPLSEIEKNDYNIYITRYIDSSETEDIQDIEAHLLGGIPDADIDALAEYWDVYPTLRTALFKSSSRDGYSELNVPESDIKKTIFEHPEFVSYSKDLEKVFVKWEKKHVLDLKGIGANDSARAVIGPLADSILKVYAGKQLIDEYDVYQHLLSYWLQTMKDDTYIVIEDGWKADVREAEKKKDDATMEVEKKHYICELMPKDLVVSRFFTSEKTELEKLEAELDAKVSELEDFEGEHSGEGGVLEGLKDGDKEIPKGDFEERITEYEDIAITELFPVESKEWKKLRKLQESCSDQVKALVGKSYVESVFAPLKNSKGKITKTNIKKRVADLKKAVLRDNTFSDSQKELASRIRADLEKTPEWIYDLGGEYFGELDVIHRYLMGLAEEKTAKDQVKRAYVDLTDCLDAKKAANSGEDVIRDLKLLEHYMILVNDKKNIEDRIKTAESVLDKKLYDKYGTLTEDEVKTLVVDDKWLTTIRESIGSEMNDISQSLAGRVSELAERYSRRAPELEQEVADLASKVDAHLAAMGFSCK